MKSTGEVLGIANTLEEAIYKGLIAAGYKMTKQGGVFITVKNPDKSEIGDVAKKYDALGFTLYATKGTAKTLRDYGLDVIEVDKIHENDKDNTLTLIESGKINYVISTSSKGRIPTRDSAAKPLKGTFRVLRRLTLLTLLRNHCKASIRNTARSW